MSDSHGLGAFGRPCGSDEVIGQISIQVVYYSVVVVDTRDLEMSKIYFIYKNINYQHAIIKILSILDNYVHY